MSEKQADSLVEERSMPSCLRNGSTSSNSTITKNRVTFPEDDDALVTAYLEPASPWDDSPVTPDDLIALYEHSCLRHKTEPLQQVIDQLKICYQPQPTLELSGDISLASLEALEIVLRRVRFHMLRISSRELFDDAAVALFDMLEYYESAATLCLTCETGLGMRSWQACSRMLKKTHGLKEMDVRGTPVNDQVMPVLCRSLKIGSKLTGLHLSRCGTSGRALIILGNALRLNSQLQELTLSDNDLVPSDASQLAQMLRENTSLRYLDISNNGIGDAGCSSLCDALCEQSGDGLQALVMWNTGLTPAAATHIAQVLISVSPLETLNIGQNQIGDQGLSAIKSAMLENTKLKLLGIQAAQITCYGAQLLAEMIENNNILQRIDARSNNIGLKGLTYISEAMKAGASLQRMDLDDVPAPCQPVIDEIRDLCRLNEARSLVLEEENNHAVNFSRKISLTCETLMMRPATPSSYRELLAEPRRSSRLRSPAPSPVPSPSSSPVPSPSRNRFRVSRVSEDSSPVSPVSPISPVVSRFRVTVVEPETTSTAQPPTVLSDGAKVHIGFEAPAVVPVASPPAPAPAMAPAPPPPSPARKITPTKPQSSMEKLLGLFHNPSSLFSSVASVTLTGDKEKNTQSQESAWDWDWSCKESSESKANSGG